MKFFIFIFVLASTLGSNTLSWAYTSAICAISLGELERKLGATQNVLPNFLSVDPVLLIFVITLFTDS